MDSIKFFNDKNLLNSSTNAKSNSKNNNIDTIKTSETVNIDKYKNKVNEVLNFATTSLESVPNKQEERKWYDFGGHIQDAFQTAAGTISNGVNCIWNNLQSAYNNSINAIGEQFSKTQVFKIVDKTIGWDIPKKVLSSVGNASVAVTKGIENVVEGTLDILQLTGGAILTPITGIVDGIIYATGNDLGLTNYLWNKQIRPSVEYKIMDNITDAYYKGHGKIMNDNAFELLKKKHKFYTIPYTEKYPKNEIYNRILEDSNNSSYYINYTGDIEVEEYILEPEPEIDVDLREVNEESNYSLNFTNEFSADLPIKSPNIFIS